MKILHIINNLQTGGAQKLLSDILHKSAANKQHEFGVLTIQDSGSSSIQKALELHPEIKYYDLSREGLSKIGLIRRIREISRQYDIIHSHLFPAGYLAAIATRGLGKPTFYTEHSTHNRRRDKKYLRALERLVYSSYTGIVAISEPVKSALANWLKSDRIESRISTIHNGVDIARYADPSAKVQETVQKPLLPLEGKKGVIMISRFTASKDQATLIRAMALTHHKELVAVFVGDGETIEENKRLAREEGVSDRCLFLGTRDDVANLINESYIGVQSSHWEGFGLTAVEMMGGGLPVIASDVPGLGEVVRDAGILVPAGDAEELAKELDSLADERERYDRIKALCRERAENYDISATVDKHIDLYKRHHQNKV